MNETHISQQQVQNFGCHRLRVKQDKSLRDEREKENEALSERRWAESTTGETGFNEGYWVSFLYINCRVIFSHFQRIFEFQTKTRERTSALRNVTTSFTLYREGNPTKAKRKQVATLYSISRTEKAPRTVGENSEHTYQYRAKI